MNETIRRIREQIRAIHAQSCYMPLDETNEDILQTLEYNANMNAYAIIKDALQWLNCRKERKANAIIVQCKYNLMLSLTREFLTVFLMESDEHGYMLFNTKLYDITDFNYYMTKSLFSSKNETAHITVNKCFNLQIEI